MRPFLPFLLLLLSCAGGVDEKLVSERLDRNNELLEKQVNLLRKQFILDMAGHEISNPGRMLFEQSDAWLKEAEAELESYQSPEQSEKIFKAIVNRFNDSMKKHSALLLNWSPEPLKSERNELLRSWKTNNFLLLKLSITEKCMELYEAKSKDASRSLVPVVYSSQFYQVQKGRNAIFDIAFKSKKPELVEIHITKAIHEGKAISLKNIDIDRYTQRFILLDLKKGKYLIEGNLVLINERGEKETFPFSEEFRVD